MRRFISSPNWHAANRWMAESQPSLQVLDMIPLRPIPGTGNWLFEARVVPAGELTCGEPGHDYTDHLKPGK